MSRDSNLAGRRFGNLTAVQPTPGRKNGYIVWQCTCDCGRTVEIDSRSLKKGWAKACGDPACEFSAKGKRIRARYEDLTGERFGKLLVQGMVPERSATGQVLWECLCDCGNTVIAPTSQLKAGYRKSCGCLRRPPRKEWIGRKFGLLTVTAYDGKRGGKHFWKCTCDCGNETSVCQSNLMNRHTTSCGCQNKLFDARTMIDGTCVEILRSAVERNTIPSNNSSGVRGVYKNKRTDRWCAQITFKGKTKYLGSFATLREAEAARKRGEEIFEEFLASYDAESGSPGNDTSLESPLREVSRSRDQQKIQQKESLQKTI